jgi:hypothetical protein
MAPDLHEQWFLGLAELRCSATTKRLRASRDGTTVADTTDAFLVWEPRRVVPEYAVPDGALTVTLVDLPRREVPDGLPPVPGPRHFELHTCPGANLDGGADIAWYYPEPLDDAVPVRDLEARAGPSARS